MQIRTIYLARRRSMRIDRIHGIYGTSVRSMVLVLLAATLLCGVSLHAQEPGEELGGRAQFAGMQRVTGEVTAVNGSTLTVKEEDGAVMQVVTTDNARVMKGRGVAVKIADLKVGDGVMAMGNLDPPTKTVHAALVFATDAAEMKKLRENLGKTYIAGKVTAIDVDNAKMTLQRPDGVSQTIGFDESTSFRKGRVGRGGFGGGSGFGGAAGAGQGAGQGTGQGAAQGRAAASGNNAGESITLADIKVGDNVGGQGTLKNGVFVPQMLTVGTPGQGRRSGAGAGGQHPPASTGAPSTNKGGSPSAPPTGTN